MRDRQARRALPDLQVRPEQLDLRDRQGKQVYQVRRDLPGLWARQVQRERPELPDLRGRKDRPA